MAALRRNDEEKRARDARRARLVERVREARRSPGAESDSGAAGPVPLRTAAPPAVNPAERPPSSLSSGSASLMGPPPPPPRRPHLPPPPPPDGSLSGDQSLGTPQSAPRPLEPPHAPARQGKSAYALDGSPSEGGTPRSRHRLHARSANALWPFFHIRPPKLKNRKCLFCIKYMRIMFKTSQTIRIYHFYFYSKASCY